MTIRGHVHPLSSSPGAGSPRSIRSSRLGRFLTAIALFALLANASTGVLLAAFADLQVSVTDTRSTVVAGELITYSVQALNTSTTEPLNDVKVRIRLSPHVNFVVGSDNPAPVSDGWYEWNSFTIPENSFVFRYLSVRVANPIAQGTIITTTVETFAGNELLPKTATDTTTVQAPNVVFDQTKLDFGNQRVGIASAPQTVTVSNNGDQPLTISSINTNNADFAASSSCTLPVVLQPNDPPCTITVTFTPSVAGPTSSGAAVLVTHNGAGNPHLITLSGFGTQPTISLDPAILSFGSQQVNVPSAPKQVKVTNSGDEPLAISNVEVSGDFTQDSACLTAPLAAGASCTINITFKPLAPGAAVGTLTITSDAPGSPHTVALSGTGTQPALEVTPASIPFGDQAVGTSSTPISVTLSNTGDAPLTIGTISTSDGFLYTNYCATSLPAGENCVITVTFKPSALKLYTDTLTINHDAPNSPTTVALTGNGLAATVSITPSSIDFGGVEVNQTSSTRTVTITNQGNTGLRFDSIVPNGDFALGATTCPTSPATLPQDGSCTVDVTFKPTTAGTRNGTLTFTTSAPGGPQTVALTGVGLRAVLTVAPSSLSFGDQRVGTQSSPQSITLVNTGNQVLTVNSITFPSGSGFSLNAATTTCTIPGTIGLDGSCVVGVIFSPTATGNYSETLTITDTTPDASHSVSLQGRGTNPQANLSTTNLDFGNQQVNTTSAARSVTLTNNGIGALSISSIVSSGNFAQTNTCGTSLAEGASCTINVTFRPTAINARTGTLTITDDAAGSPHTVNLVGVGIQPVLSLDPTSLDFGSLKANTPSAPQTITLTNTGSEPLQLTSIVASSGFSLTEDCPTSLAISESCTVSIIFTPTTVGAVNGALTITSNAPSSPHTLTLTGVGAGSMFHSIPAPGPIPMSSVIGRSNTISITMSNLGNEPLTIDGPSETINPPFSIVSDNAPGIQQESMDRVIVVGCTPTSAGPFTQQLTFTTNDPVNPTVVYTLLCTGTVGPAAGYSSSPAAGSTWDIGEVDVDSSMTADLFINETGTAPLIVGLNGGSAASAITGPNASDFTIMTPTSFPIAIPDGGAPQRLTLRCQPSDAGTRTATLTLTTNDPSQPIVSYELSCTGQAIAAQHLVYLPVISKAVTITPSSQPDLVAKVNVSATSVEAGQPVGISVTVTNQGTGPASEFWVDLYINPNTLPSAPNQPWNGRCSLSPCYGIAWYVTQPVAPGQSIILTSDPSSYYAANTIWEGSFAAGTSDLYAYVDSWNPTVAEGAVIETDETNNLAELHGLTVTGNAATASAARNADELPTRPARPAR